MPNLLKKIFFSIAAVVSFISAILLTVALGTTRWVTGTILCKTGAEIVNATDPEMAKFTGSLHYGLFRGRKIRKCGLGGRDSEITSNYGRSWKMLLLSLTGYMNMLSGNVDFHLWSS